MVKPSYRGVVVCSEEHKYLGLELAGLSAVSWSERVL